ncbi:TonB-dependent receptor [Sphingomonas ginsenosidimutans]|jgi:outer membrane receptor protein involved in Fe transport|uniref:TonB-dependent receptor n=1 Tax=Sphingomonas ginsenosidimutans TaxID=862134 RepID=A0A2A4HZX5_9SPHN|nr:TonB-dependent receptor [Sphingomonas ginsenosidimutans]PCG10412.1 TonB-dependent receptor [Sphingomonas ginsenosidimutans]
MAYSKAVLCAGAAWWALAAAPVMAQTVEGSGVAVPASAADAPADAAPGTGDIIVTAQRRAQSVNSVPMSITAIGGDQLAAQGISSTADLVKLVPGLTFTQSQVATPVYTLRGVGFYESTLSASPAVSVYVDEVPLPFAILTEGASLDIARVEVLKGPQGTLYGQNATGGAINYISAKPGEQFAAGADASLGRFGAFDASGFVSGPITDTLGARISMKTEQGGTWQRNYTRDDTLGRADRVSGRAIFVWRPDSALTVTANLNAWSDTSDVQAPQLIGHTPYNPGNAYARVLAVPPAPANARAANWSADWPMRRDDHFYQGSLRADWDLTDSVKLTSISSWLHFTTNSYQDLDGTQFRQLDSYTPGRVRSFYQELRLTGTTGPARWILGANYERDRARESQILRTDDLSSNVIIPGLPILTRSGVFTEQAVKSYAGYANLEYDVTSRLTAQGGVRYTRNIRDFRGCGYDADGTTYLSFNVLTQVFTGAPPLVPIPAGGCLTFSPTFQPGLVTDRLSQDNVSWRGGLTYTFDSRAIVYANISKGWKAGGFPTVPASSFTGFLPATQESLLAYEAGFKLPLAERTLQLNGAGFYYDYRNKQVRGRILDPIFGLLEKLVNIPTSELYGAEAAIVWTPRGTGLTANLSGTWVKSRIIEFTGYNGTGAFGSYAGSPFPFTPEWQVMGDVQYQWPLTERWKATVGANANYNSATNSTFGDPAILSINARTLVDLRAGVETEDGKLRAQLWGRNVFDKYYWNTTFQGDTAWRMAGRPATYGVTLGWRY